MFWGSSYDGFGGDGRVDRSCWAEKSTAAVLREDEAKGRLDGWLRSCSQMQTDRFPVEQPVLVPAGIHLTQPCWLSFRKYALAKGVQVGRREATAEERAKSGDARKGKLYVIWAKLPVHPNQAVAYAESKKKHAAAEAKKRKEREQSKKEEKEREELAKRQKVVAAYQRIAQQHEQQQGVASSSSASSSTSASPAAAQDILKYADEAYNERLKQIRLSIYEEKKELEANLKDKQKRLEMEALELSKRVKASVLSSIPSEKECSKCKKKCKVLVAECVGCDVKLCAECLVSKVKQEHKCYLCVESWLGKRPNPKDESSIRQDSKGGLAKFACLGCPETKRGYDVGIEYTRCCDRRICEDHTLNHNCCVCSGSRCYCVRCGVGNCGRCGRQLCSTCSIKEGCMCEDVSARRGYDDWW